MPRMTRRLLAIGRKQGWRDEARLISRRDALRAGVVAGATAVAAGLGGPAAWARQAMPPGVRRVAIIGGGFAGLACCEALVEAGVDAHVYEAESRVGGRVLTDRKFLDGDTVELGGEFIGDNHPTWLALAEKYDVDAAELPEVEGEDGFILEGKLIKGSALEKLYGEVEEVVAKLIELATDIDPAAPWTAPNAAELDGQSLLEWLTAAEGLSERARAMMIAEAEADNGVSAGRISLLAFCSMIKGGGLADYFELSETRRVDGGNDALATALARKLGDRVKLRMPIVKVERAKDGVTLTASDGATIKADAVVLAVPPTVWDKVEFTPALPASLKPQFGVNTKLIVKVAKPFWGEMTPEIAGDGLVQYGWVSGETESDGLAYTLFSGGEQCSTLRGMANEDRTKKALASIAPAYPELSAGMVQKDVFVDWPGMPRVRGSYSFPAPGQVTAFGPTLTEGIKDDLAPLLFAGEHTSYAFPGYMEGALSSGVRVAKALAARAPAKSG